MRKDERWTPEKALREIGNMRADALGSSDTLVHMPAKQFSALLSGIAGALKTRWELVQGRESQTLARELRALADIGIVNAKRDTETLRKAADMLEALDERVAIMEEGKGQGHEDSGFLDSPAGRSDPGRS